MINKSDTDIYTILLLGFLIILICIALYFSFLKNYNFNLFILSNNDEPVTPPSPSVIIEHDGMVANKQPTVVKENTVHIPPPIVTSSRVNEPFKSRVNKPFNRIFNNFWKKNEPFTLKKNTKKNREHFTLKKNTKKNRENFTLDKSTKKNSEHFTSKKEIKKVEPFTNSNILEFYSMPNCDHCVTFKNNIWNKIKQRNDIISLEISPSNPEYLEKIEKYNINRFPHIQKVTPQSDIYEVYKLKKNYNDIVRWYFS
tara:strand:+ start:1363 stop:2127 length:765 start_codon:yes stop_codon:yes gene_type:complete